MSRTESLRTLTGAMSRWKERAGASFRTVGRAVRRLLQALPLTSLGWSVALLTATAWGIASALGWQEAALVAAVGAALLALSLPFMFQHGSLRGELRAEPQRVMAGSPALGSVTLTNARKVRSLPQRMELAMGSSSLRFDVPSLAPDASFEQPFVIPSDRRGIVDIGPVTMLRGDPLGLVSRPLIYAQSLKVYVHPRVVRLPPLETGWARDLEAPTFDHSPRGDVEFHTIREYVYGDDVRHIHWRSSARIGTLMVREYVDNRRPQLVIIIDGAAEHYGQDEEFEAAMRIAASLEAAAHRARQVVTHWIGQRRRHGSALSDLLDDLAGAQPASEVSLDKVATLATVADADATVAMIISGSHAPLQSMLHAMQVLGSRSRTIGVRVGDSAGIHSTSWGATMLVRDVEDFSRLWQLVQQ